MSLIGARTSSICSTSSCSSTIHWNAALAASTFCPLPSQHSKVRPLAAQKGKTPSSCLTCYWFLERNNKGLVKQENLLPQSREWCSQIRWGLGESLYGLLASSLHFWFSGGRPKTVFPPKGVAWQKERSTNTGGAFISPIYQQHAW